MEMEVEWKWKLNGNGRKLDGNGWPQTAIILFEIKSGVKVPRNTPERWEELKKFPMRPDDVFIVSFPKSGTTWMQQIVKLLRNGGQPDNIKLDRSIPWLEILDSDFGKFLGYTPDNVERRPLSSSV